jgi:bacteriocin-like protein
MTKHQTNEINTSATSKQVRESTDRELTKEELDQVVGGIVPSIPIPPPGQLTHHVGSGGGAGKVTLNPL